MSLVDVLPTLVDLAGGDSDRDLAAPIDGRSCCRISPGAAGHDEVFGEYLAEGAVAPDGDDPARAA